MDDTSRNIIRFIAAGTGAILLLMAAYFFAVSRQPPPVRSVAPRVEIPVKPATEILRPADQLTDPAEYVSEEEVKPIDGQPSVPSPLQP